MEMEIIIGSIVVSFLVALWIQRITVRQISNDYLNKIKEMTEQSSKERESLYKLIKASDLTEYEITRPVPAKKIQTPSEEELKWNYELDRVGTYDVEDLDGTTQYK